MLDRQELGVRRAQLLSTALRLFAREVLSPICASVSSSFQSVRPSPAPPNDLYRQGGYLCLGREECFSWRKCLQEAQDVEEESEAW